MPLIRPSADLSDYDLMVAAIVDIIVDEVPLDAVMDVAREATTATEFFNATQALVELGDVLKDHKDRLSQCHTSDDL